MLRAALRSFADKVMSASNSPAMASAQERAAQKSEAQDSAHDHHRKKQNEDQSSPQKNGIKIKVLVPDHTLTLTLLLLYRVVICRWLLTVMKSWMTTSWNILNIFAYNRQRQQRKQTKQPLTLDEMEELYQEALKVAKARADKKNLLELTHKPKFFSSMFFRYISYNIVAM